MCSAELIPTALDANIGPMDTYVISIGGLFVFWIFKLYGFALIVFC